ncbi:DnaJ domain protein [Wolbachia endosymbiont of Drosophila simulans wNo]|nr:DnaJ domain protein [Wolbachia endosymbiont of Drosophila simulans wNo]QCB63006.1 molecular chaperone DnaJ [Wolbachia endosymbiont of Drosophila mauritiana]QCB64052.1 molecular chaperone DnaJ [Wolbachia endosymbiont of Drosophila mauritiana]QWE33679.1 DnaJ domain protein [Wolbachia endosymbiont of Drosophila simulans]TGB06127.1 molecular chaperone DnaJ [Wolbachia endosymbiont of Drosophila mauritiana]
MSFIFFLFLIFTIITFVLPSVVVFFLFLAKRNNISFMMNSILSKFLNEFNSSKSYTKNYTGDNMSKDEALKILGLNSEASQNEINQAYQNLMKLVHPDKGGSEYFAQKLNAARDKLMKT